MLDENIERSELSIVMLGSFNPVIITPFWLSGKSLIRESDATSADVNIIHNEIVEFDLGWASFNITQNRFHVKCTKEPFFEIVIDLVVGIFTILKETPISSFGFNHNNKISLRNEARFYELGNKLCPLANWSDFLIEPRLQRLEILEKDSKQKEDGSVLITVYAIAEPEISFGVGINVNDHYNYSGEKDRSVFTASHILKLWPNSIEICSKILKKLSNSLQL